MFKKLKFYSKNYFKGTKNGFFVLFTLTVLLWIFPVQGWSAGKKVDLRPIIESFGIRIKHQGNRPTCSVQTMTFLFEFAYAKMWGARFANLSVEYLNHMTNVATQGSGGSNADGDLFHQIEKGYKTYGMIPESVLPYQANYDYATVDKMIVPYMRSLGKSLIQNNSALQVTYIKKIDGSIGLDNSQMNKIKEYLDKGVPVGFGRAHCLAIVGYEESVTLPGGGNFIMRNSVGITQGEKGYDIVSFDFVKNNANDIVVVEHGPCSTAWKILGKFNDDNRMDIALFRQGWNSIPLYFGQVFGLFEVHNIDNPPYKNWINDYSTSKLVGDFNKDKKTDIALWREGWNSTPVYFSKGDGSFNVTNIDHVYSFNWINDSKTEKMVGDFNGDERSDIALCRSGWQSIPVYFSKGDGSFNVKNVDTPQYKNWINDMSAFKMVGYFDDDKSCDIALWRSGWQSIPVYFSKGDGSFKVTNINTPQNKNWINDLNTHKILGDFNGDGKTDIALWREGWNSTPIYFSEGDGSFKIANIDHVALNFINDNRVEKIVGDFNMDGKTDIAMRRWGWNSTPVYYSKGDGSFKITNVDHTSVVANLINNPLVEVMVGNYNLAEGDEIALRKRGWNSTPVIYAPIEGVFKAFNIDHEPLKNMINW